MRKFRVVTCEPVYYILSLIKIKQGWRKGTKKLKKNYNIYIIKFYIK